MKNFYFCHPILIRPRKIFHDISGKGSRTHLAGAFSIWTGNCRRLNQSNYTYMYALLIQGTSQTTQSMKVKTEHPLNFTLLNSKSSCFFSFSCMPLASDQVLYHSSSKTISTTKAPMHDTDI